MGKHRKEPAMINVDEYLITEKSNGKEVEIMPHELIPISAKVLPKVLKKLQGLSKVERIYQMAIINAALIEYIDKKEKELGIDLESMKNLRSKVSRPINRDLKKALSKSEKLD